MKIKKTYQGVIPNNKIVNTSSTTKTDTYSCDYTNKLHSYSTEEQVIGKWIDGRPLYQKVLSGQMPTKGVNLDININEDNIDVATARTERGFIIHATNGTRPIPYLNSEKTALVESLIINENGEISLRVFTTTTDFYKLTFYVPVRYCKTTDIGEV